MKKKQKIHKLEGKKRHLLANDIMYVQKIPRNLQNKPPRTVQQADRVHDQHTIVFLSTDNEQVETGIKHVVPFIIAQKKVKQLDINVTKHSESVKIIKPWGERSGLNTW